MIEYKTILNSSQDEFTEKKSRFIGYSRPIASEKEAIAFISDVKKKHRDATHNVFAYIVRSDGQVRCSDDGEPQGTAGVPVLDVMQKENLTDCVIVVTRYFGGTMLGAGGLVRAYSRAAKLAIMASAIVTKSECAVCEIAINYNFHGKLITCISEFDAVVLNTSYGENIIVEFFVKLDQLEMFKAKIIDMSSGDIHIEVVRTEFY